MVEDSVWLSKGVVILRDSLREACEIFIKNRNTLGETFKWENFNNFPIVPACAMLFGKKTVQMSTLNECNDILRRNVSALSKFRGDIKLAMISVLAVSEDRMASFEKIMMAYNVLRKYFRDSEYIALAAILMVDSIERQSFEALVEKGRIIYDQINKKHPFLTWNEDTILSVLLAFSMRSMEELVADVEKCYSILKAKFLSKNAIQSLSNVLAISSISPEEKCGRVLEVYKLLYDKGYRYGTYTELVTLGALAMMDIDFEEMVIEIIDVEEFLRAQSGYGFLGVGRKTKLMHATMLTSSDYFSVVPRDEITGVNTFEIAQKAAIVGAISSVAARSVQFNYF